MADVPRRGKETRRTQWACQTPLPTPSRGAPSRCCRIGGAGEGGGHAEQYVVDPGKRRDVTPPHLHVDLQALAKGLLSEDGVEHADDAGALAVADSIKHLLHFFGVLDGHLENRWDARAAVPGTG